MCPAGEHQHELTSVFDLHPAVTTGQRGDLLYVPEPEPEEIDAVYAGAKQIAPIGWSVQPGGFIGLCQRDAGHIDVPDGAALEHELDSSFGATVPMHVAAGHQRHAGSRAAAIIAWHSATV